MDQNNNSLNNINNNAYGELRQVNSNVVQQPNEQINQNSQQQYVEQPNSKNSKRNKGLIIIILICILLVVGFILVNNRKTSSTNKSNNTNISSNDEISSTEKIWKDYNKGLLTTDEYVKYMLYLEYDNDLLNQKYKSNISNDLIEIDDFIVEHYDELSDNTLKYYLDKINLNGITFDLNKDNSNNSVGLSDLFIEKVYAEENTTNLNKALLSNNGNFVIWYTTTGDSATDYTTAKKVADGLEHTVEQYTELFGYNYSYNSNIFSKGKTYKNQLKVLENSNIDIKYLDSAMQVYLVNYTDNGLAKYVGRSGFLKKIWNKIKGGDEFGVVANPYILIKPSAFSDFERLEQLYNHELFHHYQYEILCGHLECEVGSDPYILDSTANWASSLVTKKSNYSGFLNEWAGTARAYSNNLMSKTFADNNGIDNVGYALFVYLNNYSNYVPNGTSNIIRSIYENDSYKYMFDNANIDNLIEIQENIALKNFTQDYLNKNLNADPDFRSRVPIESMISHMDESNNLNNDYKNVDISALAIQYYMITDNSDYDYDINLTRDNKYIVAFIIIMKNGKYTMVDKLVNYSKDYTFNTNDYGDYDSLYVAVANVLTYRSNHYSISFNNVEKKNSSSGEYISLIDCNGLFDEDKEKMIDTYYYDENENIYKYVVTVYWKTEEEAKDNYDNNLANSNYTDVRRSGKVVSFRYTDDALKKFPSMTKESVMKTHISMCESNNIEVDYNPNY